MKCKYKILVKKIVSRRGSIFHFLSSFQINCQFALVNVALLTKKQGILLQVEWTKSAHRFPIRVKYSMFRSRILFFLERGYRLDIVVRNFTHASVIFIRLLKFRSNVNSIDWLLEYKNREIYMLFDSSCRLDAMFNTEIMNGDLFFVFSFSRIRLDKKNNKIIKNYPLPWIDDVSSFQAQFLSFSFLVQSFINFNKNYQ